MTVLYSKLCHENHTGPASMTYPENRIGAPWTGYGNFTAFVDGEYTEDQTVIDAVADLNADFRDVYDQLQAEADEILEWFKYNSPYTIGEGGDYADYDALDAAAAAKEARWFEISIQIAALWRENGAMIRRLADPAEYSAFILAMEGE